MDDPQRALELVRFGRWEILCDPAATRRTYDLIAKNPPALCTCSGCQNFRRVREQVYPPAALSLFAQVGIAPHLEAEIFEGGQDANGLHRYGGCFHLVGHLQSGTDALVVTGTTFGFYD